MTDSVPTSSTASTSTHHGLSANDNQASTATTAQQGKAERGRIRTRGRGRGRGGGELHAAGSDHEHNSNDNGRGGPSASVRDRGELAGGMHDPQASGSVPTGPSRGGRGPGRGANGRGRGRGGRGGGNNSRGGPSTDASEAEASSNEQQVAGSTVAKVAPRSSRRQQFGGKLSTQGGNEKSSSSNGGAPAAPISMPAPIDYSDLRSRLVAELTSGSYDCSICYSGISYKAPVWSCSQCHTVLHLSCVKQWAFSSVKAAEEQNAMQEDARIRERKGTWRCPGCQFAREEVPTVYLCWDGQVQDPKPGKKGLVPPHSCGKSCTKGKCPHGCSAGQCHPGPCPPCPVTLHHRCFCGGQDIAVRCSQLAKSQTKISSTASSIGADGGISCGQTCKKELSCGRHKCNLRCHPGDCDICEENVTAKCYCGKSEKKMKCGSGYRKVCMDGQDVWEGSWQCEDVCERAFDCGHHACQKACHPPSSSPPPCPYSPAVISTCPCGAESRLDRKSCQDPIRTCRNICGKAYSLCDHTCRSTCHTGPCPPCRLPVSAPCRCGESRPTLPCNERTDEKAQQDVVLCDVVCRALRHCGRHECKRQCCPLAFQAKQSRKQGSRARAPTQAELDEQDPARLHACTIPCSKPLSCGKEGHQCPLNCHRGPCPPCLQACFEEVICHCGRTVLEPPVPCGQRPVCRFPCARPPPACGHPKLPHDCHEDGPCPPCVYLTSKACDCGKNIVQNIPCHRTRVSCGSVCGALKPCGFHRCTATCHLGAPEACGECTATCGKPKRRCGHPCKDRCHAPASCDESKPCEEVITVSCPCGHLKQKTRCGASTSTGDVADRQLKCNEACTVAQRNAKLAEALGLDVGEKTAPPAYDAELLAFYGQDRRFAAEMEHTLAEFIRSPRHSVILPSASRTQRMFTHELAAAYGLATESLDSEPKRSVQIRRTQEAKVPRIPPSEVWDKAKRDIESGLSSSSTSAAGNGPRLTSMRSGTATPPSPFNALLLDGVFGVDEDALRKLLTSAPSPAPLGSAPLRLIPFSIKWVGEETVVLTPKDANVPAARLLATRPDVTRVLKMNQAVQTVVPCCFDVGSNRIMRREDRPGGSVLSSASAAAGGSGNKLSGWAAVAGSLPATPSSSSTHLPARTNPWGSTPIMSRTNSSTGTARSGTPVNGPTSSSTNSSAPQASNWRSGGSGTPALSSLASRGGYQPPHRQQQMAAQLRREDTPEEWDA